MSKDKKEIDDNEAHSHIEHSDPDEKYRTKKKMEQELLIIPSDKKPLDID